MWSPGREKAGDKPRELAGAWCWHALWGQGSAHEAASACLAAGTIAAALTRAQPHHETQVQTTAEFRLVTLAAMSFLYTALEGLSQAPWCTLSPGRTHGVQSIPCAPNTASLTEPKAAAQHVLSSNTWVILLMISSCLSALLDPSQSAPCLAKLSSKWDKASPMRWRQGKDVTPTCSCQEWMICWSGGEHTLQGYVGPVLIKKQPHLPL